MAVKTFLVILIAASWAEASVPIVLNTWPFTAAADAGWEYLTAHPDDAVGAVVAGCTHCEEAQCDGTVGFGGTIDENGETTLDAMIMDGATRNVGSVGALRRVKNAIGVAHAVMQYTGHTLLVGDGATAFAVQMGFPEESLQTNATWERWEAWRDNACQPNSRRNVVPDPETSCGPYSPANHHVLKPKWNAHVDATHHDTIGMVVVDGQENIAAGTSTNGVGHKVPGRVGDSPITGAGAYAENGVAGCAGTGDGDVMMRFLPCYHAVERIRQGDNVTAACADAMRRIVRFYPGFSGAIAAVTSEGEHGAGCHGLGSFPYSVRTAEMDETTVFDAPCIDAEN